MARQRASTGGGESDAGDAALKRWARDYWRLWLRNGRAPLPVAQWAPEEEPGAPAESGAAGDGGGPSADAAS